MFHIPLALFGIAATAFQKWMENRGSPSGGAPPGSGIPLQCTFYAVPEHELDAFLRTHSPAMHYTTYARKLAEAGYHAFSCEITAKGQELMRRYDNERVIVCTDFE